MALTKVSGSILKDPLNLGEVSIGGTLTYEDVTNVDSVGIITARSNIDCNGDLDVDGHTNLDNVSIAGIVTVTGELSVTDDIIAGDEIRNNVATDFWVSDNTFINLNGFGNLTHMGGYETNLTSNGYRDTNGQWVGYNAGSNGGAAQIGLKPQGSIVFRTDASKANGSAHNPSTRLTIDDEGVRPQGGVLNLRNSSSTGNVTINVLGVSGDSRIDLENTGDGNYSGIDFIRERSSGTGIAGGSIFMKSDTSSNNALLYIQAQSASAQSPVTTALGAANGVRLKLQGGEGIFAIETGASERLRITSDGHTLFSGLTAHRDSTRNVNGITIKSTGGLSFQNYGSNGSRNWRMRPDDMSRWGDLDVSVSPTANSATDWPDAAADKVITFGYDKTVTIPNGNLIMGSGYGIDFSATGSGSGTSTSELFHDYEEGTFSATASASGYSGGSAISMSDEKYTKIGRIVHFNMRLSVASSLSEGDLTITNLPFTASQDSVVDFSWQDAASFNGGQGKISGTSCVRFNGTFPTHHSGTANIIFSGTYITNS